MKEPQKYSMSTGLPVKEQIKKYPLNSSEKQLWQIIDTHANNKEKNHINTKQSKNT